MYLYPKYMTESPTPHSTRYFFLNKVSLGETPDSEPTTYQVLTNTECLKKKKKEATFTNIC